MESETSTMSFQVTLAAFVLMEHHELIQQVVQSTMFCFLLDEDSLCIDEHDGETWLRYI